MSPHGGMCAGHVAQVCDELKLALIYIDVVF